MSEARFVPLVNYGVELPEYIDGGADRIVVDTRRVAQAALLGCFQPDVQIVDYTGATTRYEQNVVGITDHGEGMAGQDVSVQEAQLGSFDFDRPPLWGVRRPPKAADFEPLVHHENPELTVRLNMAEVQQRMMESHARQRDPNVWATQLNLGMKQGLRAAAWDHLTMGFAPPAELSAFMMSLALLSITDNVVHKLEGWSFSSATAAEQVLTGLEILQNAAKLFVALKQKEDLRSTCFSLLPGYHFDRYLLVKAATMRPRRLVRVMDPAQTDAVELPTAA